MHKPPDNLAAAAEEYAAREWPIIPLNGKVPAIREWQKFIANEVNVRLWWGSERPANIGLRTSESGYIVVDTDNEQAEAWVAAHLPVTPMAVTTGSGSKHRYFERPPRKEIRNRQGWKGIHGLDIRGHGGYIVLPPSIHPETHEPYRFVNGIHPPSELPRFLPEWLRIRKKAATLLSQPVSAECEEDVMMRRARGWLDVVARENPAVSGKGGHNATYRVACRLTHSPLVRENNFGLGREQAIALMLEIYNPWCQPPWKDEDIIRKVDEAMKKR
jgi:hypothetical protein